MGGFSYAAAYTRRMASKPSRAPRMAERGALCVLIGAAVLVVPHFLSPTGGWHDMLTGAATVGWFAVVLGIALIAVDLVQRAKGKKSGQSR